MTTIVRIKSTGDTGVLIGTGFGSFRSSRPGYFLGTLLPREDSGETPVAAVADAQGNIRWTLTDDVEVISVDGMSPRDALSVATA